jgi:hypothetical protein
MAKCSQFNLIFEPMNRSIFIVALLLLPFIGKGQNFMAWQLNDRYFSLSLGTGQTKYFGELNTQNKRQTDFSHGTLSLEARLWTKISARTTIGFYQIRGDDQKAADQSWEKERNLSFESNNWEMSIQGVYFFRKYAGIYNNRWKFDPYSTLGMGITTFDPYTYLMVQENGKEINAKYSLRDYQTENINYNKIALIIPVGLGLKMKITPFINFNLELAYRYSFTDYLDDVSTSFPEFIDNKSIQYQLSNRRRENYTENEDAWNTLIPGAPRGNSKTNDQYLFYSFQLEVFLTGGKGKIFKRS